MDGRHQDGWDLPGCLPTGPPRCRVGPRFLIPPRDGVGPRLPVPPRDSVGPRFLIPPPRITDIVTWKLRAATSLKQQPRDPSYALPPKLRFPSYEQTPQSLQAKLYTLGVSRNLFCLPCTSQDSVISLIAAMFEF